MKKTILLSLLFFLLGNLLAQDATISIPILNEAAGSEVLIPVKITQLNSVGSITLKISYDSKILTPILDDDNNPVVENNSILGGFFQSGTDGDSIIIISWFGGAINLNSKMFDLKFQYFGGSSQLKFSRVKITDALASRFDVAFTNGSISEGAITPGIIELNNVIGAPGDTVSVNISASDLLNVGSMNLYINYDDSKAQFINAAFLGEGTPMFTANGVADRVNIALIDPTGFDNNAGIFITLKFFLIIGNTSLEFDASCVVQDVSFKNIPINYTNGSISISDSEMYLSDITARANETIRIPLNGRNLTNIGSFNLDIDFDETSLTFVIIDDATSGIFTSNVVGGILKLGYINSSGLTMSDNTIAELEFSYIGGNSDLIFDRATADVQNTSFEAVAVLFNDGSVTEQPNQAPSFVNTLPDTTIAEIEALTYLYAGIDLDGDALTFALVSGPAGAALDPDGSFSWTPTYDQAGVHEVIASLADGIDIVFDTTQITVTETNRAPYFTNTLPDTTIVELEALTYLYTGLDPDGDELTFTKAFGPTEAIIDENGNFSWTPAIGSAGEEFNVIVAGLSDGQIMVYDTTSITVLAANEAPYFTDTMPDTTVTEGILLSYKYEGEDLDGDVLTFALYSGPDGATVSGDGTLYWTPATTEDLNATIIVSLTDQAAIVYDTAEVSVLTDLDDIASNIPEEFSLGQNYPNPFNPTTTISYSLPESAMVNLTVYDITGQEIQTLLNSEISAGFHRLSFDATKLAGGVYLYRIMATNSSGLNFINTKKMLLIK